MSRLSTITVVVVLNQGQGGMHISGMVKDRLRYPGGGSQPAHEAGPLLPLSPLYVHIPPWLWFSTRPRNCGRCSINRFTSLWNGMLYWSRLLPAWPPCLSPKTRSLPARHWRHRRGTRRSSPTPKLLSGGDGGPLRVWLRQPEDDLGKMLPPGSGGRTRVPIRVRHRPKT